MLTMPSAGRQRCVGRPQAPAPRPLAPWRSGAAGKIDWRCAPPFCGPRASGCGAWLHDVSHMGGNLQAPRRGRRQTWGRPGSCGRRAAGGQGGSAGAGGTGAMGARAMHPPLLGCPAPVRPHRRPCCYPPLPHSRGPAHLVTTVGALHRGMKHDARTAFFMSSLLLNEPIRTRRPGFRTSGVGCTTEMYARPCSLARSALSGGSSRSKVSSKALWGRGRGGGGDRGAIGRAVQVRVPGRAAVPATVEAFGAGGLAD